MKQPRPEPKKPLKASGAALIFMGVAFAFVGTQAEQGVAGRPWTWVAYFGACALFIIPGIWVIRNGR